MNSQRMPMNHRNGWLKPLLLLLMSGVFAWLLTACSGGGSSGVDALNPDPEGTVYVTFTDAEGDFIRYSVDIVSLTLEKANGEVVETLPNAATLDFTQYIDLTEFFTAAQVPNGSYVRGTITLDYTDADIQVEVNGAAVPATVVDADGLPITTYELKIELEDQDHLVVAPGRPGLLSVDFDLAASHEVDTAQSPPLVTAMPFLVADIDPVDEKDIRLRGPLAAVDLDALTYTINIRPWHRPDGDFGRITVHVDDSTEFEIDGTAYRGIEGLRVLDTAGAGTPTVAFGTLTVAERYFLAATVRAGDSVPGSGFDAAKGNAVARNGNLLTIRGATIVRRSGSIVFNDTIEVLIGDDTRVKKAGYPDDALDIGAISVGQRIQVFGEVTSDPAIPVLEMDATAGLVRLLTTRVTGTVNDFSTGYLSMDLQAIDRRRISIFNFAGTGMTPDQDADPSNYEIATGNLTLDTIRPGTAARVFGFVRPFGAAPEDFEGRTVVNLSDVRAKLGIGWGSAGTATPFLSIGPDGLLLDLDNPAIGERHHIVLGGVILNLFDLPASPLIVPAQARPMRFAIKQGHRVQVFRNFERFTETLSRLLDGANTMRGMYASGGYDQATNTVIAHVIGVQIQSPGEN